MSNKTSFKRIALAVVVALGFGVLASGPSNAVVQTHTLAFDTAQAATGTAKVGETVTVNVKSSFTALASGDSVTVLPVIASKPSTSSQSGSLAFTTDSVTATAAADILSGYTASTIPGPSSMVFKYTLAALDKAGTYVVDFYGVGSNGTNPSKITYTLTVTAQDITPVAAKSRATITGGADAAAIQSAVPVFTADSSIVAALDAAAGVAKLSFELRNSADTKTVLGTQIDESITVRMTSGPGLLQLNGTGDKLRTITTKNVTDTVAVWADGTSGTGTITLTSTTLTTWTTKSVVFYGTAATASLAAAKAVVQSGVNSSTALRVTIKDTNSNIVTTSTNMFVHSSDTRVVSNGTAACAAATDATLGYASCPITIVDSGTVKLKMANYAATATTLPTTPIVTNEVEITVAGAPAKVAIAFDKRTYKPGEAAKLTVTVTDGSGRAAADQAIASLFATGGITVAPAGTGTVSAETVTITAATYGQGKYQYSYTMPLTGSTVVASATGGTGLVTAGQVAVADTVTVIDPAEESANAALDAAQEATDAAIAATDAAVLAQESADAAAVAAEAAAETAAEAAEAAKAAVDAVTKLSAEVTKLLTQFATLQKLMTRIAKKVGVKV